jgi:hypothetical protein
MSRNPSGVNTFTPSSVAPAVIDTTIDPTPFNNLIADISTELTNSADRGGRGAYTAALQMGGFKITNLGTPTVSNDAATKAYADSVVGIFVKTVTTQQFNVSGTYVPHAGMLFAHIECYGGGGGGGGSANTGATFDGAGGGGGSGGYSRKLVTAAQIGVSKVVTVPAAAAGGSAGNTSGTSASPVSVGVLCIANGGFGGGGNNGAGGLGIGGSGATAGTGDDASTGTDGGHGNGADASPTFVFGGDGAPGQLGGGRSGPASSNGFPGSVYGAGGTGGESSAASGAKSGGAGATGYVRITEYNSI